MRSLLKLYIADLGIAAGLLFAASVGLAQDTFQLGIPEPKAASPAQKHWAPAAVDASVTPDLYLDNKNGVSWRRCELGKSVGPDGTSCTGTPLKMTWIDAIEVIGALNAKGFEGRSDWRLPSGLELRSLLLDNAQIRTGKYPATLGSASSFGGYFVNTEQDKCTAANRQIYEIFGKINGLSDDFFASQRWMADNTDKKSWQNPLAINLVSDWGMRRQGFCNLIIYAFLEEQFDAKRPGVMRPHAALPVLVVHGGQADVNWQDALVALPRRVEILAQSQRESKQEMAALVGTYTKVVDYVREVMAYGAGASATNSNSGAGKKKFSCSYQCRGSLFATGGRHSTIAWGADEASARASIKADAEKICRSENAGRGGAWWADVALCKDQ